MKKQTLRFECLRLAIQAGLSGEKAITFASKLYGFVMNDSQQSPASDCNKEVTLVKRRCRIPFSNVYTNCLCNAETGEIVDFLHPEEGDK